MTFKAGKSIKMAQAPKVTEWEVVDYVQVVAVTPKAILFTFEIIDKQRHKQLVDRWMPRQYIEVDEEAKEVRIQRWLYLKEWGHDYR